MAILEDNIRRVHVKLQQLLKQYLQLQKENSRLKKELETANALQVEDQETINQLRQQVAILKVAAGLMNEADKKAFDRQINQYIKEIDKCMVMLSE
jgi:alanyl-tRNA synthetase